MCPAGSGPLELRDGDGQGDDLHCASVCLCGKPHPPAPVRGIGPAFRKRCPGECRQLFVSKYKRVSIFWYDQISNWCAECCRRAVASVIAIEVGGPVPTWMCGEHSVVQGTGGIVACQSQSCKQDSFYIVSDLATPKMPAVIYSKVRKHLTGNASSLGNNSCINLIIMLMVDGSTACCPEAISTCLCYLGRWTHGFSDCCSALYDG